jgi:hypothetical protein
MKAPTRAFAAALLAAGVSLAAPSVQAQPSGSTSTGKQVEKPTVSDDKLDAAAAAIVRVNSVAKNYRERFEAAAPADRERIADEADAAIEQAVNDSGLSVDEYNSIIDIAQSDPDVQSRILQRLQTTPDDE